MTKNSPWVTQNHYQMFLNFHTERLMKAAYKDEAVFHWRQILFYNSDFSEQTGAPDLSMESIIEQARESLPAMAHQIDKYNLEEEG